MSRPTTPSTLSQPSRSSTAPVKPRHHLAPHHHHHRAHHIRDKSVPQSAVQLTPPSLGDIFSPITKGGSRNLGSDAPQDSRPTSVVARDEQAHAERKERTWQQVERQRRRRKLEDEQLLTELQALSTLGTNTTRRLDYTYYSLLEKISSLASTITLLRDLSRQSAALRTDFDSETRTLQAETLDQIRAADDATSNAKESMIDDLEDRMRKGRAKMEALGERVDLVQRRVEGWERREGQWQKKVNRRMRILWGVLGSLVGIFVLVLAVKHWSLGGAGELECRGSRKQNESIQELEAEYGHGRTGEEKKVYYEDPRLQVFDDL